MESFEHQPREVNLYVQAEKERNSNYNIDAIRRLCSVLLQLQKDKKEFSHDHDGQFFSMQLGPMLSSKQQKTFKDVLEMYRIFNLKTIDIPAFSVESKMPKELKEIKEMDAQKIITTSANLLMQTHKSSRSNVLEQMNTEAVRQQFFTNVLKTPNKFNAEQLKKILGLLAASKEKSFFIKDDDEEFRKKVEIIYEGTKRYLRFGVYFICAKDLSVGSSSPSNYICLYTYGEDGLPTSYQLYRSSYFFARWNDMKTEEEKTKHCYRFRSTQMVLDTKMQMLEDSSFMFMKQPLLHSLVYPLQLSYSEEMDARDQAVNDLLPSFIQQLTLEQIMFDKENLLPLTPFQDIFAVERLRAEIMEEQRRARVSQLKKLEQRIEGGNVSVPEVVIQEMIKQQKCTREEAIAAFTSKLKGNAQTNFQALKVQKDLEQALTDLQEVDDEMEEEKGEKKNDQLNLESGSEVEEEEPKAKEKKIESPQKTVQSMLGKGKNSRPADDGASSTKKRQRQL